MCNCKTTLIAVLLTAIVAITGCKKTDDPNNGGNGGNNIMPTTEGVYLGIIGFNETLFQKEISLLNNNTKASFNSFIESLNVANGTGLYYADYTALKKLNAYPEPPKLKNIGIVTFTDGLDNVSTSNSEMDPEGYGSIAAYREALHEKILNDPIHGLDVTAYTIGLRGQDISNEQEFRTNLNMLASSPNNVFEVTNMTEALQRFADIADALYSVTTTTKLKLEVPGGYDEGQVIRFTFDNVSDGGNSIKYIEGTYKRINDARLLENITYHGLSEGASLITSVAQSGAYYWFEFENLLHQNGNPIGQADINRLQLWKKQGTIWQRDAEFEPGTSSEVVEDKSSALVMLVLDCTTSLGDDFSKMKTGAKNFVETLCNSNGGNSSGNNTSSPTGTIDGIFSVGEGQYVYFSKGNLQYQASLNIWQFASNQYDYIGNPNQNVSPINNEWIDLFGWGTSGWNCGNTYYQPWSSNHSQGNLYGPPGQHDLSESFANSDWGIYNVISNGGNPNNPWRTMTDAEWRYVMNSRNTISGIRYAKARVNGIKGLVLLPDNWDVSNCHIYSSNQPTASFDSNIIDKSIWENNFETNGAVFLPAAGWRDGVTINNPGLSGRYWTSSGRGDSNACHLEFGGNVGFNAYYRYYGHSVRLVQSAN